MHTYHSTQAPGQRKRGGHICMCLLVALVLAACGSTQTTPLPQHTTGSTVHQSATTPTPGTQLTALSIEPSDTGWLNAGTGIELRQRYVLQPDGTEAQVSIVRLDPAQVRFQVGYAPQQPRTLEAWSNEVGAVAAINGGFFGEQLESMALVISGGTASGTSYQDFGGMFAVDAAGTVSLRHLAEQPYDASEPLVEALQGWPMLITSGAVAYTSIEGSEPARRSVIAMDRHGHVLLIACASSSFTLPGLATWLLESDLEIEQALNLDGGSSTSLYLASGTRHEYIRSLGALPLVLLVLPNEPESNQHLTGP